MHLRVFRLRWSSHEHIKFLAPLPGRHGGFDTVVLFFLIYFYFSFVFIFLQLLKFRGFEGEGDLFSVLVHVK